MVSQESSSVLRRRSVILAVFYLFFVAGAVWNTTQLFQPLMQFMTPFVLVAIGISAAVLTYELTVRSIAALSAVIVLTFLAEASGANLGFPFGDYAYTDMLGPKLIDVPLTIPFAWLAILIPGWIAAERFLKFKHVVVASVLATAADALLESAADSLDLWHWRDGLPTELNYLSWFVVSYVSLSILKSTAKEKPAHWIVPHLLSMQLLYFALSDAGIRFLRP